MSSPPTLRSPTGVQPQLTNAIGGIWRLTASRVFSLRQSIITSVVIVLFAGLTVLNSGHYFLWLNNVYLMVIVPVLAFLSGGGLVRDDMNPAVVDYVLTRPIPRPVFLCARVVCHLACLQVWCVLSLLAATAVGVIQNIPGAIDALPLLLLAQVLVACAFGVLGGLAGTLTARYLVVGIIYGGVIEAGLGNIPMQVNRLSILHHVRTIMDPLMEDTALAIDAAQGVLASTGFVTILSVGALIAAAMIFSTREFAGVRPKDT